MANLIVKGARTHNLKNVNLEVLRNKINVLVGVSGSGKSTIAYDIIAAEGQRQFLESISTYAARLLKRTQKPDVDSIKNLSPTIAINQKKLRGNPRFTVGTATEIYTYLRLLFSRFGTRKNYSASYFSFNNPKGACKKCKGLGEEYTINPKSILDFEKSLNEGASKLNNYKPGARLYNIIKLSKKIDLDKPIRKYSKKELDFLLYSPRTVLSNKEQGFVQTFSHEGIINRLIKRASDLRGVSKNKEKNEKKYWVKRPCQTCNGGRLNSNALSSKINNKSIGNLANMQLDELVIEVKRIRSSEAKELVERIIENTQYLIDIDLGYLSLNRSVDTLSGGESQRLKLARELGSDLIEMIYILDEPTAGLHPKDLNKLVKILHKLKEGQNTVLVVEHDTTIIKEADQVIEVGPGAGNNGGRITFTGNVKELTTNPKTITGKSLQKSHETQLKEKTRKAKSYLQVRNACIHNLKNVNVRMPLGVFCCVTGVSGSGKSSLIIDEFANKFSEDIVLVDQSQIVGSVRGNAATFIGVFDIIRGVLARKNKVSKSIFSSNSKGACPDCKGLGFNRIDMHFMGEVKVQCETCQGKKYQEKTLNYKYKDKNIHEILNLTVNEALKFFEEKEIQKKLLMLNEVGLGYLTLGQTHNTLSGGERQRLKLASKLHKSGKIFILDEPTSGLHFADIEKLLKLLNKIVDNNNSVIVIEHNLNVIKQSDWIIDLGPKGGDKGGEIIGEGTPLEITKNTKSITGQYLL
ncbi:MAG: excinuclease ABC subunit UvrA [archaeon]